MNYTSNFVMSPKQIGIFEILNMQVSSYYDDNFDQPSEFLG